MKKAIKIIAGAAILVVIESPILYAQSPGDTVGTTRHIVQSAGAGGNRVAVDSQSGVHFVWTNGMGYSRPRYVYYNYLDPDGNWMSPGGADIGGGNGSGYCQIDLTSDNCAGVTFHLADYNFHVVYGQDLFAGSGIFELFYPPDMLRYQCFWPYLAIDTSDAIHIVMLENTPNAGDPAELGYTRSTNGGADWTNLTVVDTLMVYSQNVTASPVSEKVAILYSHPTDLEFQLKNDIFYIESENGADWDWTNDKINVTEYGQDGDSLFAYYDLDAIYDYNDNLHMIWKAFWVTVDGVRSENFLYHYSSRSGMISLVDSIDIDFGECDARPGNHPINNMTLGVQEETNTLYTIYTRFDPDDCSSNGYANGDLFIQYSVDDGISWTSPENITNSQSPDCIPGECYSDLWPSLADKVTDYLHIFYVVDRAGGGSWDGNSPLLYYKYPSPETGLDDDMTMPHNFTLAQNYPNPFNNRTMIEFELKIGTEVKLAVYDVTGALIEVLYDGYLESGKQSIAWNPEDVASGAYFYKLATAEGTQIRKMVLLK